MQKIGKLISIEGIEGVGKSTAVQFINDFLKKKNVPTVLTREPGGTTIAEEIRQVLLAPHNETMALDTELLLMFAGRAQNIAEIIQPNLRRGVWVIADRYVDASFAYQGGGRGIEFNTLKALADWALKGLWPDLTILLDAPVDLSLQRVDSRGARDRIELEGTDFFERVRTTYLELAASNPDRFCIVDATQTVTEVEQAVVRAVNQIVESI